MFTHCIAVCAATDPTNGAGLGGDILTIQALGGHPLSIVTAITVQDTVGVQSVHPVDSEVVAEQWQVLVNDIYPSAVKWGMVGNFAILDVLCHAMAGLRDDVPIVIDPVLASGRGDLLADEKTRERFRTLGLGQKKVVLTPNFKEFYAIMEADQSSQIEHLVSAFFEQSGAGSWLLLKGVHAATENVIHTLWGRGGERISIECPRFQGEYHGSGCTLASALTVFLAQGKSMEQSLKLAQNYTWQALESAYHLGHGQAIPNRSFQKNYV